MKTIDLLESRKNNWAALEQLCARLENRRKRPDAGSVTRFASLYRAACADLALADAYDLPPGTVQYLHHLVGRAHNQLYQGRTFQFRTWAQELFSAVPRRLYGDNCFRVALLLFWGLFLSAFYLASNYSPLPGFAHAVLGDEVITEMETMYDRSPSEAREAGINSYMAGFYAFHNTGIGLRCFAAGLLFGVGGLFATVFNAMFLGAVFGYMSTVPQREHFFEFVTAHGPFELTAIVLSAAVGMRLGFSLVNTRGYARLDSLRRAAREAMPSMGAAIVMFFLAALIEGFVSPSALPYSVKASVAIASTVLLLFYFVGLGYPGFHGSETR